MTSTSQQYSPQHGGFVPNIKDKSLDEQSARPYKLYADGASVVPTQDLRTDMIGHLHSKTPLNEVYFSSANVDRIQEEIRQQVYLMSGNKYVIDRQSDDDLHLVMRSYYLMFALNNPAKVAEELEDLNRRVIGYCAAKIYSEVDFHMFYKNDLEEFAPPIANPMNTQVFGTRSGELKAFF